MIDFRAAAEPTDSSQSVLEAGGSNTRDVSSAPLPEVKEDSAAGTLHESGYWRRSLLAAAVLWGVIFLLFLGQDAYSQYFFNGTVRWQLAFLWASGWLYWIPFTPICWWATTAYPLHTAKGWVNGIRTAGVGLAVCGMLYLIEALHVYFLSPLVSQPIPLTALFQKMFFWKAQLNLLAFGILIGAAHAWNYYRRARAYELEASRQSLRAAELERSCTQARIQALQMQLQPHFLFNTHHAIIGLMLNGETRTAIRMLTCLSDLLRHTLTTGNLHTTPLRQELEWLGRYLEIQKIRFGDRLSVRIETGPETAAARVPCLILQPLVENSIKHAIEKNAAPGWIRVTAHRRGEWFELVVEDSGASPTEEPSDYSLGTGLANIQARLQQLYGAKQQFEFKPTAAKGGCVRVAIPFETNASSKLALVEL